MNTIRHRILAVFLAAGSVLGEASGATAGKASATPDFNRDIHPILSENCFACHGPDAKKVKAGLRLDRSDVATAELKSGRVAVIPQHPEKSELIRRLTTEDPDDHMPPAETGKRVTPEQIELLKRWIASGAEWQPHWSYRPLRPLDPPDLPRDGFIHNDVDRFLVAKLREKNLPPSPPADRVTLLRRLSFDLTGLPPAFDEVKAFLKDRSPGAYEKRVDALLASEAYGERMAMYWLDLVRYADTCGYHGDQHVDVSLYRDYVIKAFNDNKPFDLFTVEQLAGDLLPEAGPEQKIASGYNRLLMTTEEGGAQPKEYMAKYAADRVRNASTVWLGATMGCCECHDHKFDPFTTRDFYSFAAFFADVQEKAVGKQDSTPFPSPEESARLEALQKQIKPLERELDTQTPELDTAQAQWEKAQWHWTVLPAEDVRSTNGTFFEIRDDESIFAYGKIPDKDTYAVTVRTGLAGITAFRLEVLPDDALPNDGPGRYDSGNFVLSEFEVHAGTNCVEWGEALATFAQDKFPVANAVDGKPDTGWAVDKKAGQIQHAIFQTKTNLGDGSPLQLTFILRHEYGDRHNIGRFRLWASTSPPPGPDHGPQPPPVAIAAILQSDPGLRSDEEKKRLSAHYRGFAPLLEPSRKEMARLKKEVDAVNKGMTRTLITTAGDPRLMRILPRGNWQSDDGDVVEPAVPAFLAKLDLSGRRATRLDLAKWLTAPDNPLVARVFVNRLWKIMFGRGIVKTLDDFGSQGAWPAQLDLLDWLAFEFIQSGWDVKHMMKLMALSGAYRQSSDVSEELAQADPYNELFARQGRFRLDAEMVRDNALAVSALLARQVGGPSVKPYQPAGYWDHLNFPKREYKKDEGDNLYRRSLYTYWCRTFLHPSLAAFDAPTREECTVERVRSNTPQQALVLLNDPIYVEAARVFAELMIRGGGKTPQRKIRYAFQRILSRKPNPAESELLTELFEKHLKEYRADPKAARALLEEGDWPLLKDIDRPELAAWASVARVILNLHETITRR
jgi:mono/diheme cytochrome c family protein